ncbi:MAG: methyltransferase domain-containing protein [Novosphingobium sp.]
MTALVKLRVAGAFNAATDYAAYAKVQHHVATDLADSIAALAYVSAKQHDLRLLEIGCGTGFLTQALLSRGIGGRWVVTDIAPGMITRCAETVSGHGNALLEFATMDGEAPLPEIQQGSCDLICSSLAFQWFGDLSRSLARLTDLLAPGGVLAFTTLLDGTFHEWEQAHCALGLASGGLAYPGPEQLAASFPPGGTLTITERVESERHADARAFLRSVKRIGAGTSSAGRKPLLPAELRRVMARFEVSGATATYRVAHCFWTRDRQQ